MKKEMKEHKQPKQDCHRNSENVQPNSSYAGYNMDTNASSLSSLVVWNISKAREKNPNLNLQIELENVKKRLESRAFRDIAALVNVTPLERHLVCALLAWQTLGNNDIISLIRFVELQKQAKEETCKSKSGSQGTIFSMMGPVVTLPVDLVKPGCLARRTINESADIMKKIDAACSIDTECAERLEQATKQTNELQERTRRLAEREAHRVELLERAEMAWHNLELGFLRKLQLAEDKEHLLSKKLKETEEEHQKCEVNLQELEEEILNKNNKLETARAETEEVEKTLCGVACTRHRLEDEASKKAAALAEQQCKFLKIERDVMFKEDLSKSRVTSLRSDLDSAKLLTLEAERVVYNELLDIKNQTDQISAELLALDSRNREDIDQLDSLERERLSLEADVLDCKARCDSHMEGEMDKLRSLREEMNSLREQVLECRCKLPVDAAVEVKRTPSLVITCDCTDASTDEIIDCSCTSLRHKLLSDLLSDLFGGLQDELLRNGCVMPCEILKCLDDKHNWERSSPIKAKLRTYFSELLLGELDIAIATSIEKYHAKWIGSCCRDVTKKYPEDCGCKCSEDASYDLNNSVDKVVERRAQELIEKIFLEQANKYVRDTKTTSTSAIINDKNDCDKTKKVFTCQTQKPKGIFNNTVRRTNDFGTQILEDCNKIKNLKPRGYDCMDFMDKQPTIRYNKNLEILNADCRKKTRDINNKTKLKRDFLSSTHKFNFYNQRQNTIKKKTVEPLLEKKNNNLVGQSKIINNNRNKSASYSVHMCYETTREDVTPSAIQKEKCSCEPKLKDDIMTIRQSKYNSTSKSHFFNVLQKSDTIKSKSAFKVPCKCMNKTPSNTSLNKLLETLGKWQIGLKNKVSTKNTQKNFYYVEESSVKRNIDTQYEDLTPEAKKNNSTNSFITATEMNEVPYNRTKKECSRKNISGFVKMKNSRVTVIKNEKSPKVLSILKTPVESREFGDVQAAESEYMGEINLDKSNETQCRCEQRRNKNILNGCAKYGFKCINSNVCHCEYSNNEENPTIFSEIDKYLESGLSVDNASNTNKHIKSLHISKISKNTSAIEQKIVDQKQQQTVEDILQKSVLFPHNCDYDINFLGATLTNEKHSKLLKTSFKNYSESNFVPNSDIKSGSNTKTSLYKRYSTKSTEIKNDFNDNGSIDNRFEDLKKYFNNVLTTYGKNMCRNEDKALDVPSVRTMNVHQGSTGLCICCDDTEEVDLEINAFELLREHLKCKLEDLKKSPIKLPNIPKEEEEKLFSCILQKVKEVISENTNMSCKCEEQLEISNCSRAYELLKEYLETKLRRAKGGCITKTTAGEVNYNIPELLDKVSNLIESDFELLKLQKFKKEEVSNMFEIPEKDVNEQSIFGNYNNVKFVNHMSNETDNFECDNTSCQVSLLNVEMKSKSCTALDFNNILCENKDTENNSYKEMKENIYTQPKIVENDKPLLNNSDKNMSNDHYKGCTIQCSCDTSLSQGQCFCIKSLLKGNYSNMESLDFKKNQVANNMHAKYNGHYPNNTQILDSSDFENTSKIKNYNLKKDIETSNCAIKFDIKSNRSEVIDDVSQFGNLENNKKEWKDPPDDSDTACLNCDCELVPVCHVKMLVENIENKLAQSKCMCDLFCAKFCPVHSKKR